ncbi:MAG: hypothetical protein IJY66_00190 [Clostridia bacterium]|nr:hypothetical protein [Clostridia bacterium]
MFVINLQNKLFFLNDTLRIKTINQHVKDDKTGIADQSYGNTMFLLHTERKIARPLFAPFSSPASFKNSGMLS